MIHSSLWTKNFTIITLGTLVSAIGGVAMNLALSLVVFDQTGSTWLSGLFGAIGMLPGVLLPALISPLVDRLSRKRLIVGLDLANGVLYLCFLLWIRYQGFQYGAYLLFTFLTGCIGAVYSLTFQCFYPQLIPAGQSQRGYAVSAMIYPLTTTLVTPLAAVVYDLWGIQPIFCWKGCCFCWPPPWRAASMRHPLSAAGSRPSPGLPPSRRASPISGGRKASAASTAIWR